MIEFEFQPVTPALLRELADDPEWERAERVFQEIFGSQPSAMAEIHRNQRIREALRAAASDLEQLDKRKLRDDFARAALPVMAAATMRDRLDLFGRDMLFSAQEVAQRAFDIADAMLAESERRAPPATPNADGGHAS